ncbi:hypothetical protein DFH08DRAFT_1018061 [Mycena albidolilacea]|uniref:Uncharacterized protein n=1 Tax=Mycena albidolilacea TaxID=1033008 RepID=A0AAD6ZSD8_9AGAR|nr:hypothetical protein DFH08DRAFT_1018061 [Mycena albidolilacea]
MLNPQHADTEHYELYPTDPRLVGSESAILLTVFEKYQLLLDFTLPSKPDGCEDKDFTFYAQLHERLTQHMADHHLHFSGSGVSPSMAALPPASAPTAQLNRWHASRFESLPWVILAPGIKPKPGFHRKISATPISWYQFSGAHLTPRNHWTPLVDAINPNGFVYFIGPKHGPLKGPLQGQTVPHMCFLLRIQCSGSPLPSPRIEAASGVGLPVFCTAATDSDEEGDQLRHAIELSLAAASSSALAEAGPSRRPLPAPPVNRRPRSLGHHSLSPPYTRRRLDPVIDLRSVSPSPVRPSTSRQLMRTPSPEVTRRLFRNLTSWVLAMQLLLSRTASSVTAPSVEAAVHTLLIHFESFFGGDPYTPRYKSDAVVIEPSSQLGLFARRSSWKSGDALGPGVRRGILNGLMDTVFANSELWKKIGDTHVVNVSPAGVVPDERRLRLLTTYGFACRLYVAIESVLPPPLSLLLVFAVLSPGLEQDVIHNPAVIRMFAPHQVEMLEQWPAKRTDFLAKANEDSFMDLVNSHFGLLVMRPVHYNYARQILFGCQVAFANSPEICAFANGFNGPSFGASLKSLLIKMAAGRIQSPRDVLERLDWQSTGDPEPQAIEALYRTAFHRYLSAHGIVRHPLLPHESLTEAEREIPDDYPLARALMFLIYQNSTAQMVFFRELGPSGTDYSHSDPANNPERWLDRVVPVRGHTCFYGVDLPLRGPDVLLRQDIPDDATATDFDAYLYIMFRPASLHMEFGGIRGRKHLLTPNASFHAPKSAKLARVHEAVASGQVGRDKRAGGKASWKASGPGKQAGCRQQAQCNNGHGIVEGGQAAARHTWAGHAALQRQQRTRMAGQWRSARGQGWGEWANWEHGRGAIWERGRWSEVWSASAGDEARRGVRAKRERQGRVCWDEAGSTGCWRTGGRGGVRAQG